MKLKFACMECLSVNGEPSDEYVSLNLTDDGIYTVQCNNGHTTLVSLQQHKFEILFDMGINALIDGYPREAVATIASSLERFYEFYIDVICIKHNVNQELYEKIWSQVKKQSERQYGAYLFLNLIDSSNENEILTIYDKSPEGMKENWSTFRNKIIHEGYIPQHEEAFKYIDFVYQHICKLILKLKENDEKHLQKAVSKHVSRVHQKANGSMISFMSISTIISISRGDKQPDRLNDAINPIHLKWQYKH